MTSKTDLVTRHLGHCQICEGEFKLHEGNMVHHGYERPGSGSIVGDCFGVRHLPYEKSSELCSIWLAALESKLAGRTVYLARLEAGEVDSILELGPTSSKTYRRGECSEYEWSAALGRHLAGIRYTVVCLKREIDRMTKRIASWVLAETKTLEEHLSEVARVKAASAELLAAKRASRAAKLADRAAKAAALEARRIAEEEALVIEVRELAGMDRPDAKRVYRVWKALQKAWQFNSSPIMTDLVRLGIMKDNGFLAGWMPRK